MSKRNLLTRRDAETIFKALTSQVEPKKALTKLSKKYRKEFEYPTGLRGAFRIIQQWPLRKLHLEFIAKKFRLSKKQAAVIAGISVRTYDRWKLDNELSPLIAESIFKLAEVYDNGLMVFDNNEESFMKWMRACIPALNYEIPIDLLDTRAGMELVSNELLKIEYGVI